MNLNTCKPLLIWAALLTGLCGWSQDSTWRLPFDSNSIPVHRDPRVDQLIRKQIQINEETSRESRRYAKGFRLLVINTNNRQEAIAAKTRVYTSFPELKPYLIYQSPYFKLKVGNFRDRKDAEAYQKKLEEYFPKGVFVINDIIEVKPEAEPDNPESE
ncbi:MAG TPA: hypothetical protein VG870_08130 [Chitinophagaceae bacterium]|nr:hypothetical protein [Chitinophagaceae bacterium]